MNPCIFQPNCLRFFWSFFPFLTKLPCLLFIPDITYLQNLSYDLTDKNNPPFQMLHIFLEYDVGEFGVTSRQHQLRS